MSAANDFLTRATSVLIGNYARQPVDMVRGEGAWLWDSAGNKYLDLFAGFGGGILGHCHPALVQAVSEQAAKLWHVGNTFYTEPQVEYGERLRKTSFDGRAFFCHSGAESNEAACKLARLRGQAAGRWKVISLQRSFHGRTLAMIAATGNPKVRDGFSPEVPGFCKVPPGDFNALKHAVDKETAAIILEPIQGEGGIHEHAIEYIAAIRKLCDEQHITLIFDEVWTGGGRTGKWFGYQHFVFDGKVVEPDIMTLGKAVGGGLPVGTMWAKPELAKLLVPGKHGCTLGGNPICMAAARTIFDIIEKENLLAHAEELGKLAVQRFRSEKRLVGKLKEVRGKGLMLGLEMEKAPAKLVEAGLSHGIIINLTADNVIRLAPPINIKRDAWELGLDRVVDTLAAL